MAIGYDAVGEKTIPNLYQIGFAETMNELGRLAAAIEENKIQLAIPENYLSDAFLTFASIDFVDPLLETQIRKLGDEDLLHLLEKVNVMKGQQ